MIIYGKNVVKDLFTYQKDLILEVYIDKSKHSEFYNLLIKEKNIKIFPFESFNNRLIKESKTQKIVAKIKEPKFQSLSEIVNIYKNNNSVRLVMLDQIQDSQNFGAIIRNVSAFSGEGIIFAKNNSAPFNSTAISASSGTWVNTNLIEVSSLNNAINFLKKNNFWIAYADKKSDKNIEDLKNFNKPLCIIFGSEGKGVRNLIKRSSDLSFRIDISNDVESLNVSSAVAISLYLLKK